MMDMARMEEAAQEAWRATWAAESTAHANHPEQCPNMLRTYLKGFLAGARWRDKQSIILGVDFASGPDRTVIWPNAEADRAAEDEG